MSVLEALTEEESYLWAILQDHSGIDLAEFAMFSPAHEDNCFRAWPFQWFWWRSRDPYQIDLAGRSVGKTLSIVLRMMAFPFIYPGQEAIVTAPELVHLEPLTSLIESYIYDCRLTRELLINGRGGKGAVTHRPFQMNFVNGSRIIGRIPQRDGRGVKGCVAEGTLILSLERGFVPVETLKVKEVILSRSGWSPIEQIQVDENDCVEVTGSRSNPITVSCDHRFYGSADIASPKQPLRFGQMYYEDVTFARDHDFYWATPSTFPQAELPGTVLPVDQPAFWWLVGRWLADGFVSMDKKRNKARKVFWCAPPEKQEGIFRNLKVLDWNYGVIQRSHSSADCIAHSSSLLYSWLCEWFGQRAEGKRMPGFCLGLSRELREELLEGYLAGDGHWDPLRERWTTSSASKSLSLSVQMLAQSLGYSVTCSYVQPKVSAICGTSLKKTPYISWRVMISKRSTAHDLHDYWVGKIKSVVPVGIKKVFNVITNDHTYQSESIMSHNIHPIWLELDEASDYPEEGWTELTETLKRGFEGATWRAHGVTRGIRDKFYEYTQETPDSYWKIHRITALHRPNWTDQERQEKIKLYGSKDHPDYKRNILGQHGDSQSPLFVLNRLLRCVDSDELSDYNQNEYAHFEIKYETINALKQDIVEVLQFPHNHLSYRKNGGLYWVGMDVGFTLAPSEILVFAEHKESPKQDSRLKLITRINLQRVAHGDQIRAILWVIDFYRPRAFSMDSTGVGLPLFQSIQERVQQNPHMKYALDTIKGYNFSQKLLVGFDDRVEIDEYKGDSKEAEMHRNVLEFSSDLLRDLVDNQRLQLPWDRDLIGEFQGQTYTSNKRVQDLYGRRVYSKGKFHCLDAARMAVLGHAQYAIEKLIPKDTQEDVLDMFVGF